MILLIEDNEDIRENFAELLMLEGFAVETVDCGIKAINLAEEQTPSLVICDIMMPGMDSYEVLTAFRQNNLTCNIPFIFSSSKAEKADALKAKALGATHFFVKPFDVIELMSCIKKCLQE